MNTNINLYREQIDNIDDKLLILINKRAELSKKIAKIKNKEDMPLYIPSRETEILEDLCKKNKGPLYDDSIRKIFTEIIKVIRESPSE